MNQLRIIAAAGFMAATVLPAAAVDALTALREHVRKGDLIDLRKELLNRESGHNHDACAGFAFGHGSPFACRGIPIPL